MIPSKHKSIQGQQIQQSGPGFLVCLRKITPNFPFANWTSTAPIMERLMHGGDPDWGEEQHLRDGMLWILMQYTIPSRL